MKKITIVFISLWTLGFTAILSLMIYQARYSLGIKGIETEDLTPENIKTVDDYNEVLDQIDREHFDKAYPSYEAEEKDIDSARYAYKDFKNNVLLSIKKRDPLSHNDYIRAYKDSDFDKTHTLERSCPSFVNVWHLVDSAEFALLKFEFDRNKQSQQEIQPFDQEMNRKKLLARHALGVSLGGSDWCVE